MCDDKICAMPIADLLRSIGNDLGLVTLADKIEEEIEAARKKAIRESKKPMWWFRSAIERGEDWPEPRDDETFREYLNRCFILRPRDESGEPVQFSDSDIDWENTNKKFASNALWDSTAVDCLGRLLATSFNAIVAVAKTDESGRVKRLSTKAVGIDGKPIFKGQTVWLAPEFKRFAGKAGETNTIEYGLCGVKPDNPLIVKRIDREYQVWFENSADSWCPAFWLIHTETDTQALIDRDALKDDCTYWNCYNIDCDECPSMIDGEVPASRYGTRNCGDAKMFDILRRQRELDARKVGEAFGSEMSLNEAVKHIDSIISERVCGQQQKYTSN